MPHTQRLVLGLVSWGGEGSRVHRVSAFIALWIPWTAKRPTTSPFSNATHASNALTLQRV